MANFKFLGRVAINEGDELLVEGIDETREDGLYQLMWVDSVRNLGMRGVLSSKSGSVEGRLGQVSSLERVSIDKYFTLVLGACRPQMLKRIFEVSASFPIKKIVIVGAERAEKSYLSSRLLKPEGYLKYLKKGVEQAGIPYLPEIQVIDKFWTLGRELNFSDYSGRFVCDGRGELGIGQFARLSLGGDGLANRSGATLGGGVITESLVAVGPESGWSERELELFKAWDFTSVLLGQGILRVDVALISALSVLRMDIY